MSMYSYLVSTRFDALLIDPEITLRLVAAIAATSSIIACLEFISLKRHFMDSELFSWKVVKAGIPSDDSRLRFRLLDAVLNYPNFIGVFYVQIAFSLLLICSPGSIILMSLSCLAVASCYLLSSYRGVDGFNGGDSLNKVICLASGLGFLSGREDLALYFITFQLVFSYTISGFFKSTKAGWFNGDYLLSVWRQKTYGREFIWRLFRDRKVLVSIISSSVVILECCFLLVFWMPTELQITYLAIFGVFHILNALIMGLSAFVLPFFSTYLALLWVVFRFNE